MKHLVQLLVVIVSSQAMGASQLVNVGCNGLVNGERLKLGIYERLEASAIKGYAYEIQIGSENGTYDVTHDFVPQRDYERTEPRFVAKEQSSTGDVVFFVFQKMESETSFFNYTGHVILNVTNKSTGSPYEINASLECGIENLPIN